MLMKKNQEQQKKLNNMIENSLTSLCKDREMFDEMTLTFLEKQVVENGKFLIYGDVQTGKTALLKALVNEFDDIENITLLEEEIILPAENIKPLTISPDSIYIEPVIRKQKDYNLVIDELSSKQALYLLDTMGVKAKNSVVTFSFNEETDKNILDALQKYISYIKSVNSKMLGTALTTLIYTKLVDNQPKIVKVEYFSPEKEKGLTLRTLFDETKKDSEKKQSTTSNAIEEQLRNSIRQAARQGGARNGLIGNQPTAYRRNRDGAMPSQRAENRESTRERVQRMIDELNNNI